MNKEEPIRDQAERLRKKIEKKEKQPTEQQEETLPPRSRVHLHKKKKTKFKLKYPLIRLLALFFILLPIVSFSIYTINENNKKTTEPVSNEQESIEPVDFEDEAEVEDSLSHKEEKQSEVPEKETNEMEPELPGVEGESSSLPSANDKATNEETAAVEDEASGSNMKFHKVQPNENLYRIAKKYYNDPSGVEKIKKANGIRGNEIKVGETLKIPMD